jgi:hypothetical protein
MRNGGYWGICAPINCLLKNNNISFWKVLNFPKVQNFPKVIKTMPGYFFLTPYFKPVKILSIKIAELMLH